MTLKILLIISIILQLIAAVTAIRLMKSTKYNVSWVLFTAALIAMTLHRLGQFVQVAGIIEFSAYPIFFVWIGIITSLCIVIGIFYVNKIFKYIGRTEHQRRMSEKRILSTILRTEEKERMRFAKELHDGMGPLLSSAKMQLSALDTKDMSDANLEILENTKYVIEEAIRSVREISNNLSPHVLKDFGLARAITNFVGKTPSAGIEIDFQTNLKNERFDIDVETIIYRVVCELVNNSIKHSGCTKITLTANYSPNNIDIVYTDNGCGFNPEAVMEIGMGMSNIVSRVQSLKGSCRFTSAKNEGMKAEISIDPTGVYGR